MVDFTAQEQELIEAIGGWVDAMVAYETANLRIAESIAAVDGASQFLTDTDPTPEGFGQLVGYIKAAVADREIDEDSDLGRSIQQSIDMFEQAVALAQFV